MIALAVFAFSSHIPDHCLSSTYHVNWNMNITVQMTCHSPVCATSPSRNVFLQRRTFCLATLSVSKCCCPACLSNQHVSLCNNMCLVSVLSAPRHCLASHDFPVSIYKFIFHHLGTFNRRGILNVKWLMDFYFRMCMPKYLHSLNSDIWSVPHNIFFWQDAS